jgi:hypothetical protein
MVAMPARAEGATLRITGPAGIGAGR